WWVRHQAALPAHDIVAVGADTAVPTDAVLQAISTADVILLPPSNPVVSIGTILAVPGVRDALLAAGARIVGVSPIIGGSPVRGMADACLTAIGVGTSAQAVAEHYGARSRGGLLDGWLVDSTDDGVAVDGLAVKAVPLWMTDVDATAEMARAALALAL
ncbi:MAG: 2-phospho-L-lactate transferase CofD family protein, partial [Mycobacteriales bacterium]